MENIFDVIYENADPINKIQCGFHKLSFRIFRFDISMWKCSLRATMKFSVERDAFSPHVDVYCDAKIKSSFKCWSAPNFSFIFRTSDYGFSECREFLVKIWERKWSNDISCTCLLVLCSPISWPVQLYYIYMYTSISNIVK